MRAMPALAAAQSCFECRPSKIQDLGERVPGRLSWMSASVANVAMLEYGNKMDQTTASVVNGAAEIEIAKLSSKR